jgi:hypothetical protein
MCELLSFAFLFVISFPVSNFFCGTLPQYLVFLVLIVIIYLRLISLDNRIKISLCIHHMSLATLEIVVNSDNVVFLGIL